MAATLNACVCFSHSHDPRCADALYSMPMPRSSSESSTKVHLQRTLRRGDPVVDVRTLTRCGTSEQSLVLLEAMKSPASDGWCIALGLHRSHSS